MPNMQSRYELRESLIAWLVAHPEDSATLMDAFVVAAERRIYLANERAGKLDRALTLALAMLNGQRFSADLKATFERHLREAVKDMYGNNMNEVERTFVEKKDAQAED